MKLRSVSIAGYRSVRNELDFQVDDRVTAILGANDHGKTNVLEALLHLNPDHPFDPEIDLNWDCHTDTNAFPAVRSTLELSAGEREQWLAAVNREIELSTIAAFRGQLESDAAAATKEATEASKQASEAQGQFELSATRARTPEPLRRVRRRARQARALDNSDDWREGWRT